MKMVIMFALAIIGFSVAVLAQAGHSVEALPLLTTGNLPVPVVQSQSGLLGMILGAVAGFNVLLTGAQHWLARLAGGTQKVAQVAVAVGAVAQKAPAAIEQTAVQAAASLALPIVQALAANPTLPSKV